MQAMTQSMIETYNVQGMLVGRGGQTRQHDQGHLQVVQLQEHKVLQSWDCNTLLARRVAKAQGEFVSIRNWRYRAGLTTWKCVWLAVHLN